MASSPYSKIKEDFDRDEHKMFTKDLTECDRLSIQFLSQFIKPEDDVLEIGCGKGNVIEALNCNRYGIDISSGMLKDCRIEDKVEGNMDDLPYPDDMFDLTFMIMTFQQSQNRKKTLSEMRRVTKERGMMIIIDGDKDSSIGHLREEQIKTGEWKTCGDAKWLSASEFPEWTGGHLAPHILWLSLIKIT